ncbi:hypothetical protein EYM_06195 [Ignicoccus islandicus DSM 13165]|uniref:Acetyl-CoA synthetase n=1 Tax=Ignicoccus islandicus DSM 13165 TaxID=940295 RepID=A0A0U3FS18_9CREN|nr:acetate--CoA ligase family protein [Ignicoccus islandicus]ALU12663.1 hypothetical protein EYM_06195 [Ignicoccus islandicus DSM 13165]
MLLRPSESLKIAEELGIPVPEWSKDPSIGAPAYVKADVPLPHKTEAKAVTFAESEEELKRAFDLLKERYGEVIVQRAVKGDLELLVSSKLDEVFGRVAVIAMGGIYASLIREAIVTKCPVCEELVRLKLANSKIGQVMRYRKKLNEECVVDVIKKLCLTDAKTFEVNPLIVSEENCWAVDVKVWI